MPSRPPSSHSASSRRSSTAPYPDSSDDEEYLPRPTSSRTSHGHSRASSVSAHSASTAGTFAHVRPFVREPDPDGYSRGSRRHSVSSIQSLDPRRSEDVGSQSSRRSSIAHSQSHRLSGSRRHSEAIPPSRDRDRWGIRSHTGDRWRYLLLPKGLKPHWVLKTLTDFCYTHENEDGSEEYYIGAHGCDGTKRHHPGNIDFEPIRLNQMTEDEKDPGLDSDVRVSRIVANPTGFFADKTPEDIERKKGGLEGYSKTVREQQSKEAVRIKRFMENSVRRKQREQKQINKLEDDITQSEIALAVLRDGKDHQHTKYERLSTTLTLLRDTVIEVKAAMREKIQATEAEGSTIETLTTWFDDQVRTGRLNKGDPIVKEMKTLHEKSQQDASNLDDIQHSIGVVRDRFEEPLQTLSAMLEKRRDILQNANTLLNSGKYYP